nr:MAG TPA: hypothetical protein [Caudoviricetes sp.]
MILDKAVRLSDIYSFIIVDILIIWRFYHVFDFCKVSDIPLFLQLFSRRIIFSLQWGISNGNTKTWVATLPISSSESYAALAGDIGYGAIPIGANANFNAIHFYQQSDNPTTLFYLVISKV